MSRASRSLLLVALLGVTFALSNAPSVSAQAKFGICNVKVIGLGDTESEAVTNAVASLYQNYFVSSYRIVFRGCDYTMPSYFPPCRAELSACAISKPRLP
jgi:hypothetical protein